MFAVIRSSALRTQVRAFSAAPARRNLISDLYVKELKGFKPTPLSAADAEGATKPWAKPASPKVPSLEGETAEALQQYETSDVETVQAALSESASEVTEDWFVFPEEETAHH
ncbi:ATP synthase F0 subcomplex subunit H atp14 [Komagataella kurtzmanii]|nr:ATP synthase F0 subcomplex subunit H atp14 [Komagataella kurtzmanii]